MDVKEVVEETLPPKFIYMERKMKENKLKWYIADKEYVNYLRQFDEKVENIDYNTKLKPYIGRFQQGKSPIVIVDDEELLIRLCREYESRICPIYMQRDVTDLDFIEELRKARKN